MTAARPVVLLIDYFGVIDLVPVIAEVRAARPDVLILEDDVQAPFSLGLKRGADFSFTSYRKSFAVPDGAEIEPPLSLAPAGDVAGVAFANLRLAAALVKASALDGVVDDAIHLDLFARAEHVLATMKPTTPGSSFGRGLLERIDQRSAAARRRANFHALDARLSSLGLSPLRRGGEDAVPLCLPVLVTHRSRLRAALREERIYCPVHWPAPSALPAPGPSSRHRYHHELSLPIDQRYDEGDMARVAEALARLDAQPA